MESGPAACDDVVVSPRRAGDLLRQRLRMGGAFVGDDVEQRTVKGPGRCCCGAGHLAVAPG